MASKEIKFKPLSNRVVIEPIDDNEQMSAGGIYIPDTAKEKPQEGKVVAVGPGKIADDGKEFLRKFQLEILLYIQNMLALNTRLVL